MQGVYVRLVCCSRFDSSTDPAGRCNLSNVREVGADYERCLHGEIRLSQMEKNQQRASEKQISAQ